MEGKTSCSNDGYTPAFMNDSPDNYLFSTKKECCDQWFSVSYLGLKIEVYLNIRTFAELVFLSF
jgi:hypothetical protein